VIGPILSRDQRLFIRQDTSIDQAVIDRCVRAFELVVDHDDVEGYKAEMMAVAIMVGDAPKPTAMDVMKTIIITAYADRWRCSYTKAHRRLQRMLVPS
jgi:hypothetical protein